jgi:CHAD domain-containing protein
VDGERKNKSQLRVKMKKLEDSLHADEPLRAGLLRLADGLIQNAVDRIRCPTSDRTGDVHLVRVTIKRLRALMRLIRPVISERVFAQQNTRLKKAAWRLSLARDSDVARQTLATLPVSSARERQAVASVLAGFSDHDESRIEISKAMNEIELELEQTRVELHQIRISGHEWEAIGPGLEDVYRQCRKRMRCALGQGDDEAFHKWRIRVKNLFYELQTLQPVWPERLVKMIADLRQLEENIGADHDLVVLKQSLVKTPDAFGGAKAVEHVVASLSEKSKQLRREAEPLGKAIFHQTSRGFVRELGQYWSKWREIK